MRFARETTQLFLVYLTLKTQKEYFKLPFFKTNRGNWKGISFMSHFMEYTKRTTFDRYSFSGSRDETHADNKHIWADMTSLWRAMHPQNRRRGNVAWNTVYTKHSTHGTSHPLSLLMQICTRQNTVIQTGANNLRTAVYSKTGHFR